MLAALLILPFAPRSLFAANPFEVPAMPPEMRARLTADSARYDRRGSGFAPATGASAVPPRLESGAASTAVASWREILPPGPTRRVPGITAYDPARDRLVVVSGSDQYAYYTEIWTLASSGTAEWTPLAALGTPPAARAAVSGVFDPVGNRVLMFGGYRSGLPAFADLWALTLTDPPTWTSLTPAGAPPAGRWNASAVYDPTQRRMLMFGGETDAGKCSETWSLSLDGPLTWTRLATSGDPPVRALASVAVDPVRGRLVIHGGQNAVNEFHDDTWALELTTSSWSPLTWAGTAIGSEDGASLTYDPAGDRLVLFGGNTGLDGENHRLDGTWSLDLAQSAPWAALTTSGMSPSPRFAHGAAYDSSRGRVLIFGGIGDSPLGDAWSLDLGAQPRWTALADVVRWPDASVYHQTVYDSRRDRMLVLIGDASTLLALPLSGPPVWQVTPTEGGPPASRWSASAIYDPDSDRVILFGGYGPGGFPINETWSLSLSDPPTWRPMSPGGTPPRSRDNAAAIYDPVRRRMVVYGGDYDYDVYRSDAFTLNLDGPPLWSPLEPQGTPPSPRSAMGAIYDSARDRLVVTGGRGDFVWSPLDAWALAFGGTGSWQPLAPELDPSLRRSAAVAVYDSSGDQMLMWSGFMAPSPPRSDLWSFDLASGAWIPLGVAGPVPAGRGGGSGVFDAVHRRMLVWGGSDGVQTFHDLWELTWETPTAVAASLVEARIDDGHARLAWWLGGGVVSFAALERREAGVDWREVGRTIPDGAGRVEFVDSDLVPSGRFEYRLAWSEAGLTRHSASVWLELPAAAFALQGARPNPAVNDLSIAFSLGERGDARMSLTDIAGRRVIDRALGGLDPGPHSVTLGRAADLAPGLYLVTLRQGARAASRKLAVIHE